MRKAKRVLLALLLIVSCFILASCSEKAKGICNACEKERVVKSYRVTNSNKEVKYMSLCNDCLEEYKDTVSLLGGSIEEIHQDASALIVPKESETSDELKNDELFDVDQNLDEQEPQNIYEPGSPEYWDFLEKYEGIPKGYLDATISPSQSSYKAGIPVTINVVVNGGVPPFTIHWYIDEMWSGNNRKLDDYWKARDYRDTNGDYVSSSNNSSFEINLPLQGNDVYVHVDIQDNEKRISNLADITIMSNADDYNLSSNQNTIRSIALGETITFGHYEQDNNLNNGSEPIEWIVLEVQDGKALLLSRYGLDLQQFTEENGRNKHPKTTWEQCSLRKWLNNDFMDSSFTSDESKAILLTYVDNSERQGYDWDPGIYEINPGNDTQDKVFLLSYAEAHKYFDVTQENRYNNNQYAKGYATKYVKEKLIKLHYTYREDTASWWLRTINGSQIVADVVNDLGSLSYTSVTGYFMIRPAIWITLSSIQ